jgi:O-antigen ligase
MTLISILWLMVWGGVFTGPYNLKSSMLSSPLAMIQGFRALLPILAAYFVLLWILAKRSRFPFYRAPLRFFFLYILIGFISTIFLSPQRVTALYWASAYLAPFLVIWMSVEGADVLAILRRLIIINYAVIAFFLAIVLPEVIRGGNLDFGRQQFYVLPFGLGEVRANGVGRYALIVVIFAFIRFFFGSGKKRFLWLGFLAPALYALARTQSRTALLGLAVAGALFVFLRGIDWRLLFAGPLLAYVVWISGVQWRVHGRLDRLMSLTGREYTWQKGLAQLEQSPFLGWGFHADRLLLNSEHMHNSYLHAALHSGIVGAAFFAAGLAAVWLMILKAGLFRRIREAEAPDRNFLLESVMILGFLTARSFFESTGAFFGVDLLLLIPAIAYLWVWSERTAESSSAPEPFVRPAPAGLALP